MLTVVTQQMLFVLNPPTTVVTRSQDTNREGGREAMEQ